MATKSKFFRVFVEGDTVDGREIKRQDIQDIADTYNPKTYGARVNLEHMRGLMADGPFQSLGDVTAVKAQEDEIEIGGKTQKRLALYAEIQPLPALIEINKRRQKIYTSCEIALNFAKSGKAGLVGLAITDSPASLGTEMLEFAVKNPSASPFTARKANPDNVFSVAREVSFNFVEVDDEKSEAEGAFAALKALFTKLMPEGGTTEKPTDKAVQEKSDHSKVDASATDTNAALFTKGLEELAKVFDAGITKLSAAQAEQANELKALKADLEKPQGQFKARPKSTGADTRAQTDC